ncbi:MAG: cell division topological specificity factor MinE [Candidatus Melainabacteria bacterium]|nr:MAG: cell division topological specificity factor MinE [Candidatus Melainabacteria bacterium]
MRDIFTDLYKKVIGFFQATQDVEEKENAKDVARNRLKLVLMQDRTNLTPYLLERMRGEMIEVLSKYVEMDKDELELNFEQEGDSMALMLSIPVLRAKDEEEIQAAIDAEEKAEEVEEIEEESIEESESNEDKEEKDDIEEESLEEEEEEEEEVDKAEEIEEESETDTKDEKPSSTEDEVEKVEEKPKKEKTKKSSHKK